MVKVRDILEPLNLDEDVTGDYLFILARGDKYVAVKLSEESIQDRSHWIVKSAFEHMLSELQKEEVNGAK
jgi:hypothetical protein